MYTPTNATTNGSQSGFCSKAWSCASSFAKNPWVQTGLGSVATGVSLYTLGPSNVYSAMTNGLGSFASSVAGNPWEASMVASGVAGTALTAVGGYGLAKNGCGWVRSKWAAKSKQPTSPPEGEQGKGEGRGR